MKTSIVGVLVFCVFMFSSQRAYAVDLDDGDYHQINDSQYQNDNLRLDYNIINNPGTHLELIDEGIIQGASAYHNSMITNNGGTIGGRLYLYDSSMATINSGVVGGTWTGYEASLNIYNGTIKGDIESMGTAKVSIYGGVIEGDVEAWNDCITDIYGGTIDNWLQVYGNGVIYLHGTDFMIGSHALSFGESLRDFGSVNSNEIYGRITGQLQDGSLFDNTFTISILNSNADIIIIPEPASLSLLTFGSIIILRIRNH